MQRLLFPACLALVICLAGRPAVAQSGGLPHMGNGEMPYQLAQRSWWYQQLPPARKLKKHDIVTVVVNVRTQVLSDGNLERRTRANLDAVLTNWIRFDGLALKPAPQRDGSPQVTGSLSSQYRAEGEMETRDRMQFTIAAKVADVLPNGQLIIEAQQMINNNEEMWKQTLRGCVRPEDIQPNNKVLSENIADLTICKEEMGSVRDSYRRGWLGRFYDYVRPF